MKLKLRSSVKFLASIFAGTGTAVRKDGLATYVDLDYDSLEAITSFDASTKQIAVHDSTTGEWNKTTLSDLLSLAGYAATSLSPATIGLGSVSFTTQAGLAYRAGARARASSTADTSDYMEGLVTSYSGATLTIDVSLVNGSGTFSSWNLSLAGDPGTGDMLSTNNGLDFANLPTTLNNLGGVSFSDAQSLSAAEKLLARQNIGVVGGGVINIVDYGGVGDGATANDTAFNNAYAALGTYGGVIYFPAGKYVFNSGISKTFPAGQFSVTLAGDGANCTTLYWPNSSGGIEFISAQDKSTFHLRDFTVETDQAAGGNGFKATGTNASGLTGFFWQSDITNVDFSGSDRSIGIGTKYWSNSVYIHSWSYVTLTNVNTWGPHGNPGDAGGGTGLLIEGDTPTANYTVIINVQSSSFNSHVTGVLLGNYWQGITFNQCNFNGRVGTSAIFSSGTFSGVQVLLSIFNSQIDYAGIAAINLGGSLTNVLLQGNLIAAYGNNGVAVIMPNGGRLQAIGNSIGQFGAFTGTFGIVYGGADGVIMGNIFTGVATPVNLQAASSNVGVSQNRYNGTGANIDNGTGNNVGTVTQ